jgi:hypothetical protein
VGYRDVYGRRVCGLQRCLWEEGRWATEMFMGGGYVGYRDVYGRRVGGLQRCLWKEGRWATEMSMEGG